MTIGGCIESIPAVWDDGIYVGGQAGQIAGISEGAPPADAD